MPLKHWFERHFFIHQQIILMKYLVLISLFQFMILGLSAQDSDTFEPATPTRPVVGMDKFIKQFGKKLKYPKEARRLKVEGKVLIQFIVHKNGHLSTFKIIKGIGNGCDEEAIRVIKLLAEHPKYGKWKPAIQYGKPIDLRYVMPVSFRL